MKRIGPEAADCDACELYARCHGEKYRAVAGAPPVDPDRFNGLMIIGEGPGETEVARDQPFCGKSGQVLDDLLEAAGFKREETYITNATLGKPPKRSSVDKGKTGLHGRFPNAIYSCIPRLEAEIAQARPRVVVTMGAAALHAATGTVEERNKHVDNDCERCDPKTRKVGPAVMCAKGDCGWRWMALDMTDEEAKEAWKVYKKERDNKCPNCGAKIKNLKVRQIKCPWCGGRKKKVVSETVFKGSLFGLTGKNGIAGALFAAEDLPSRWDELGVEFVICTLHPAFCLRSSGTEEGFGGQFAALAMLDHLEKAKRLLERAPNYDLTVRITDRAEEVEAFTRAPGMYDCDVETDALSPWDVTELRVVGITRADRSEALVVDTRRMIKVLRFEEAGYAPEYEVQVLDQALYDALRAFLTAEDKPKTWQGGSYDCVVLWRLLGVRVRPIGADTKVAHHSVRPDEPHTLAHIAAGMTDALYWKQPKRVSGAEQWESFEQLVIYNAHDCRTQSLSRERMAGHCPLDNKTGIDGSA